jgi:hypothetical protein
MAMSHASSGTPTAARNGAREPGTPVTGHELSGGSLFVSDVETGAADLRIVFRLVDSAYGQVVTRVFGVPREKQSFLVKLILTGAAANVLAGYAAQIPRIHPSRADTAMGFAVLNTALRGIGGAPSAAMPAAGLVIGLVLLRHSLRLALTGSARDVEILAHDAHVLAQKAEVRYGHHPTGSDAAARTA